MTTVSYGFEGGTNGATVAAGAGAGTGDTNFDAVSNASSTDVYDTAHAAHGSQGCKVATSATAALSYNAWTTSIGTQTSTWMRAYLYFTATPTVQHRVLSFVGSAASRGNMLAGISANAGKMIFTDSAGTVKLTSATFPLNAWFRVEVAFTGSATAGQWEYKIWYTPDSTGTPDDTQITAANLNTGGTTDSYRFGISASIASAGPYWLDDVGVSTTGYLGPAGGGSTPVSSADTGHGAEASALAVTLAGADTGHAAEAGSVRAAGADTGHAAEAGSVHASLSGADTGHGTENAMVPGSPSGTDSGHAAEAGSVHAALGGADLGHAAEAASASTGAAAAARQPRLLPPRRRRPRRGQVFALFGQANGPLKPGAGAEFSASTEGSSLHAALSAADTGHAAETANSPGGANVSGHDAVQAVESAFYYHSSADAGTGADGAQVHVSGTESAHAAEVPRNAWPGGRDTARAAETARWSGPLVAADAGHAAEAVRPFPLASADAVHGVEVLHEMGIWTFLPVNVRLAGKFWRVTGRDERDREVVMLEAERLDGAVLRLAERLLLPVPYRHDAPAAARLDTAVARMAERGGWAHLTRRVRSADAARSAERALAGTRLRGTSSCFSVPVRYTPVCSLPEKIAGGLS